jgi:PKD repeat protein
MIWILACQPTEKMVTIPDTIEAFSYAGEDFSIAVGQDATFDSTTSTGVLFEWDFGDGQQYDGQSTTHRYQNPGHYQVVLTAYGSDGSRKSDVALITVHYPLTENPPAFSSTIAVDEDNIWTVLEEGDLLSRLSIADQSVTTFNICDSPRTISIQESLIGVACQGSDQLAILDTTSELISYVDLPENSSPYGVAGRDGEWWITLSAIGQIAHLNDEQLSFVDVGPDPRGISLLSDGRVITTRWRSSMDGGEVYLSNGTETTTVSLGIDNGGDSDNTTGGIPNLLEIAIPSPDGKDVVIPMLHANTIRGVYQNGLDQNHENTLRAILSHFSLDDEIEEPSTRKHFDERGRASAAVFSPLGDYIYVLHPGTGTITILDAFNYQIVSSIINIGNSPSGLAIDKTGNKLFVFAWLDREVQAYDISSSNVPEQLWSTTTSLEEPLDEEVLIGKKLFYSASDTRITRSGYISCAYCHPDAEHDGQTWDFTQRGEGLRNTTTLKGIQGTKMGRLHWTGNFDEVQDFENDIRYFFAGDGLMSDEDFAETSDTLGTPKAGKSADLDALAAYLDTLTDTTLSPFEENLYGEQQFHIVGCSECHFAPLYTDSDTMVPLRHNVGTATEASGDRMGEELDGFDTPTLLGLWSTAPYLHDGQASTIEEAILAHQQEGGVQYENLDQEILLSIVDFIKSL